MKHVELVLIWGVLALFCFGTVLLFNELGTVRPNVERIILDINHVSK